MAYDLDSLKRVVEDAEKFLAQPDSSITEIKERIDNLVSVLAEYQEAHNTVVENNKDEFNSLVTKVAEIANDLDNKIADVANSVEDLTGLTKDEVDELASKIKTLRQLTDDIDVNVLNVIDVVADTVNEMRRSAFFNLTIDSADGSKQVDITSFGFEDANYGVVAIVENDWTVQPLVLDKSKDSFKIGLVDRRHFADFEIYKDCSAEGAAVNVNVILTYNPTTQISKVIDVDGNEVNVGK